MHLYMLYMLTTTHEYARCYLEYKSILLHSAFNTLTVQKDGEIFHSYTGKHGLNHTGYY